ncbi:Hypothetical predicted protein [Mytilus galloprovincialis]|uniref:Uncharacterized protein n=2 Tax=Mytilus galloprovincialis TaxID=29158 RepID=A0A8B6CQB3_MYTGA|nr:Hypothetical predicted protein [Mytilus galloprovincialis]
MFSMVIFFLGCLVTFHSVLPVSSEFVYRCTCKESCSETEINSTITCGQYVWCCNKTLEESNDDGNEGSNDEGKSNKRVIQKEKKEKRSDFSNEDAIDPANDTIRNEQGSSDIDSQKDQNYNKSEDHDKTIHRHKAVGIFQSPETSTTSILRNGIKYTFPTQKYPQVKPIISDSDKLQDRATSFRLFVDRYKHPSYSSKRWFRKDPVWHKSFGSIQMPLNNDNSYRLSQSDGDIFHGDSHHPTVSGEYQDAVWGLMKGEIRKSREPSYRHPFETGYGVTLDSRNENLNFYFNNENGKESKDISLIDILDHQIRMPTQIPFSTTTIAKKDMFSNKDHQIPLIIHKESVWTDYFRDLKLKRKRREKEIEERHRQSLLHELFPLQQTSSVSMPNIMFPFHQIMSMNPWIKPKIIPKFPRKNKLSPRGFGMKP